MLSKILQYTSLGITSVSTIFFPLNESTKMAESEVPFVSHVSTGLSAVSAVSALVGFLNKRKEHALLKWVAAPLILLHLGLLAVLFGTLAMGSFSKFKNLGLKVMGYVSPVISVLMGGYIIYEMASDSENSLNVEKTGTVINKMPAILAYPPLNKHPLYLVVIFVRTGGLVTKFSGQMIETAKGK